MSLWFLIVSVVVLYGAVAVFIQLLKSKDRLLYFALGAPHFSNVFSRDPDDWKIQFRLIWFVLSGKAYAASRDSMRVVACVVWVAYISVLLNFLSVIYVAITNGQP